MSLRLIALLALVLALPASAQNLLRITDDPVTDTTRFALDAGGGLYLSGSETSAVPSVGTGTQLMWWPGQAALRAGSTNNPLLWSSPTLVGDHSVAFGRNTEARGSDSFAAGSSTRASGASSVAMGRSTTASGDLSMALGLGAFANSGQFSASFSGGYLLRSGSGGVRLSAGNNSWSSLSDSTQKENVVPFDADGVLSGISRLRLGTWNYKGQDPATMRHWGPMAQDFSREFGHDRFGTVGSDTTISTQDADGVLFAAVQALEARTRDQAAHIERLEARLDVLDPESRAPLAASALWAAFGLLGVGAVISLRRRDD